MFFLFFFRAGGLHVFAPSPSSSVVSLHISNEDDQVSLSIGWRRTHGAPHHMTGCIMLM